VLEIVLERYRDLLKAGAVLIDPHDPGEEPRTLFYLEHSIQDARLEKNGQRRIASQQVQFVELNRDGTARPAGYAPYLDYRPLVEAEQELAKQVLEQDWLKGDLTKQAMEYAIHQLVPEHLNEVKRRKEELVQRTIVAVTERLTKEIMYWDRRANELKAQELAGKTPKLNSGKARQRADDLQVRKDKRLEELEQERKLSALPPVVVGGALIIPAGLLLRWSGKRQATPVMFARETKRVELAAMAAVMAAEKALGFEPKDVSRAKCGYDIESHIPGTGKLRFIEVKGRISGAEIVTVTKNEILAALNKPEDFILALVEVPPSEEFGESDVFQGIAERRAEFEITPTGRVRYLKKPFVREPDFGAVSINYDWHVLWELGRNTDNSD